jgi:hypothetical protein
MVIEDRRLPRPRSGDQLTAGGTATHEVRGWKHSTPAQQLDLFLLYPRAFPGSLRQSGRSGILARGRSLPFGPGCFGSHPGVDLDEWNDGGASEEP